MIGRAGRLGQDTEGESILVCQKDDYTIAKQLLTAELPAVSSCLRTSGKLKRAILEVIASGVVSSPSDIALFSSCTLLSLLSGDKTALENPVEEALEYLKKYEFVSFQKSDGNMGSYSATALGKACLSSSIGPDEAITLFAELERARKCFVLETELHLIYLVTPYTACTSWGVIDWIFYLDLWNKLPVAMKRVGELVGVSEFYIVSATRGKGDLNSTNPKVQHKIMVHKRFFVSLVLQDLVNEVPLMDVCLKFNCNRGMLQSLQQSAATFAGMVTAFSRQLGWSSVEILLAQFQDRLQFGVSRDLLDLMRLQSLTSKLARTLYKAGIETLIQLANSEVNSIETILLKFGPFESSNETEGEGGKKKMRSVWIAGKESLTRREAAELLVKEARNYLEYEMGLKEAKWTVQNIEEESMSAAVDTRESQEQLENPTEALEVTPQSEGRISNCSSISNQKDETGAVNNSSSSLNISDSSLFGTENDSLNKCISGSASSSSESFSLHLSDDDVSEKLEVQYLNPPVRNETKFRDLQTLEEKKRARLSLEEGSNAATPTKKSRKMDTLSQSLTAAIEKYTQLSLEDDHYSEIAPQLHFRIVDVCKSKALFKDFMEAIGSRTNIAFSIAYEKLEKRDPLIGGNICVGFNSKKMELRKSREVQGFLVYWGGTDSSFLSADGEALEAIRKYLKNEHNTVRMFDAKKYIKILIESFKLDFQSCIDDPKVGDWLLDLDGWEKNLSSMINSYYEDLNGQVLALCDYMNNPNFESDPKIKACTEVILTWHLVDLIRRKGKIHIPIIERIRFKSFPAIHELEMKTLLSVAKMEINGIGIDRSFLQHLVGLLKDQKSSIERKAYSLAGRKFNFSSSSDVSKVIGTYSGKKSSTKKKLLERSENPISDLVIQWRKLNYTLTQTINPLLRQCQDNRIYGSYDGHTSTGRISMHEPNIQMVPKDFSVLDPILKKEFIISCRSAFRASKDCILISADYCQLELRVLTYLSRDEVLLDIMGKPGDIFTSIAAKWNNIPENMVDNTMRQNVKQICYGIIYGMRAKTLAEQMEITTEDATEFMETFHNKYSGMKEFILKTVDDCKKTGYVESIAGRRRYLTHINHEDPALRSRAERKAVNTKVQGSAADIVKTAMMAIDGKIEVVFRKSTQKPKLVLHLHDELIYEVSEKYLEKTVRIIRANMENSPREFGHFPVKIKTGYTWGHLEEYHQ
ncbi:DNA polymerase theta-like [Euwallacea similis]|uniref:DNA polymerase theta-like n=1 Tax=Euwallacea similis TaxID=1736056 RepID=UPI00344F48E6